MIPLLEKVKNIDLTASEKLLFDYIQEDPKRIIHQNLQDICQKLYISNATIVRFCQKIGYQGFHEFKFAIRSQLEDITENDLSLDSYFNFHLSRFKDAIQLIPFDQLETISKMFHSYSMIYIYGSAMSSIRSPLSIQCIIFFRFFLHLYRMAAFAAWDCRKYRCEYFDVYDYFTRIQ